MYLERHLTQNVNYAKTHFNMEAFTLFYVNPIICGFQETIAYFGFRICTLCCFGKHQMTKVLSKSLYPLLPIVTWTCVTGTQQSTL